MAQHNGSTNEVTDLAWQLMDDNIVDGYEDALEQAHRQIDGLLSFAEQWDAAAEPEPEPPAPVYIPSALTPAEQRAMDKALFARAGGLRPRIVGRFAFVPSRSTGGVVYRTALDGSSCSCKAGEAGRTCWHSFAVVLERELAA